MDKHQRCEEEGCQVQAAKGYRDCEQSSGCCDLIDTGRVSDRCERCPFPNGGCIYPRCGDDAQAVAEKLLVKYALDLFGTTNAHAFKVQIPNTHPPLFIVAGEAQQIKDMLNG